MKVRNKEYQSLGIEQLKELAYDYPNDAQLGEEIRKIIRRATVNNPKGSRATSRKSGYKDFTTEEVIAWQKMNKHING
tara:strand:- start:31 stop:264 length:234 start_codon:yes stop_codon:yes gene_type:complete